MNFNEIMKQNAAMFSDDTIEEVTPIVSGTDIVESEDDGVNIDDLLKNFNSDNAKIIAEREKAAAEEEANRIEQERKAREEAIAENMRKRAEEEALEREKFNQELEEARIAEENTKKKNPLNLVSGIFDKMKKPKEDNSEPMIEESTQEFSNNEDSIPEDNPIVEDTPIVEDKPVVEEKPIVEEKPKKEKEKVVKEKKSLFAGKGKVKDQEEPDFKYLATHDTMTGLLNRTAFDMALEQTPAKNMIIIFFDVNNLKKTNDSLGHSYGNKLITATADELTKLFPEKVYRIGGDEFIVLDSGIGPKIIDKKIEQFNAVMETKTKSDEDGLIYAVSSGYAIGNGKLSKQEIQDMADKSMYQNKEAYKKAHPELNARLEETQTPQEPEKPKLSYDEMLTPEQRELKELVRDGHIMADEDRTDRIMAEIQMRHQEILAILIASPDFNNLFILRNVSRFLNLVARMDNLIDYSYLYVVYEGGPQYYGSDDYYQVISHLFEDIAGNLKYNRRLNDKEVKSIKGINIFKNIYID